MLDGAALPSDTLLVSILTTGFAVAFLHAALPTHWLPFVLVGRGQGWSAPRILGATALAGGAHVLFTALLGLLLLGAGVALDRWIEGVLPLLAAALLVGLGLYYLLRPARKRLDEASRPARRFASDRAALISLVALLGLSPSEGYLPIYLSGAPYGWVAFVALSLVLAAATAAGMAIFTIAALAGAERLRLHRLERYESLVLGSTLCLLGVLVLVLHP
ncbi:MAG TPA: hypothetical protein VD929_06540 [Caulobacteraceae bacterium]|nr:hypothetical protein [Caulobacteraceae bacterium]